MSLVRELCRIFHAKRCAIECALRHGQVTVDGYVMRVEYDQRWTRQQLEGRMAAICYSTGPRREHRLYR